MRLIDADKLPKYDGYVLSAAEIAKAVDNAPTVDAVEVIRCKDCVDWMRNYTDRAKPNVHPCRAAGHATTADFFCGLAERVR